MTAIVIAFITFACIAAAAYVGGRVRSVTPAEHLSDDSREIVIAGLGLVSTLAAVVLGLLIDSAKGSFDTVNNDMKQLASKVLVLDSVLAQYGPETREARTMLKQVVAGKIAAVWPEDVPANTATGQSVRQLYVAFADNIQHLAPTIDSQRSSKAQAQQLVIEIAKLYTLMQEEKNETVMLPVVLVLVLWLVAIFAGFGLIAPANHTVRRVLMLCALSVALSILLIMELDDPLAGILKVSSAPLLGALTQIAQ